MDITTDELSWYWFKGNEVSGRLLQDVCLFRSCVLFDSGFRSNFGNLGKNFGDIQYSDFESYHIVACYNQEILGTIRISPSSVETVTLNILGLTDYQVLIKQLGTSLDQIVETNRLTIDERVRKLNLGRTLIYASIALIENIWDRSQMTIIGSAGNNTKQTDFITKHTDYKKIPDFPGRYSSIFNDQITFLKYDNPPYTKGAAKIEFFKNLFKKQEAVPWPRLTTNYQITPLNEIERAPELTV